MAPQAWQGPTLEAIEKYYTGMRPFWHPVLPAEALPNGEPRGVELLGEPVVLARLNGQVVALQDLCRHFQARLSLGEVVEHDGRQCLMCHYHGWTYAASGQCVAIPQLARDREIPREARLPAYRVQECYDLIWVCLAETPRFDLPAFPELGDPAYHPGPLRVYQPWQASAPRVVMGALDDTHFPWVHAGILGDRDHPEPPDHAVWRDGDYLVCRYSVQQPHNLSTADLTQGNGAADYEQITYTNYVSLPGVIRLVKVGDADRRYVIWLATCPHRHNLTTTYWRVARNYDLDPAHDADYERFEDAIRAQDQPIVESQRPWLLPPFWTKVEMPLRPADLPLIEYQRWLEELGIATGV